MKQPAKTPRIPDDIDDDFFHGTVLASSGKGKARTTTGDECDDLPPRPSTPRTRRSQNALAKERAPSSSPPPLTDYTLPHAEPMRKGVSKFDLRDDEWMMVEDEFLETAKLFTRHLHIAEYDRLKESIEAKKKEAEVARPVVAGAKRSVEGVMKERAKVQESKQKEAIRDVFASQDDHSEDDRASYRAKPSKPTSTIVKPRPTTNASQDTDSDDLDAPRPPKPKAIATTYATVTKPKPTSSHMSKPSTSSFTKPALPASPAPPSSRATASRPRRATPFHMLDEYTPPRQDPKPQPTTSPRETQTPASKPRSHSTPSNYSPPRTLQNGHIKPPESGDLTGDWGFSKGNGGAGKEVADRLAKRRAKREENGDGKGKRRATDLDDIPTFLC